MKGGMALFLGAVVMSWASALDMRASPPNEGPVVDLGYAKYQGYYNATYDLNVWKGVRYAAPPIGNLRWQKPQPVQPSGCNGCITPAIKQPPICPQSGAFGTPKVYGFNSGPGNEDCLYLNVYAAPNASALPVFVWIHGGGYSLFGATYDPSVLMNRNNNGFITVEIQYRLGAFGFLSSKEIKEKGQLNAGLLDQRFALEWVQQYITQFGGDPNRVTIAGESAGAGSVMHHGLAYGGKESNLFNNIIAASPYVVSMYHYDDKVRTGYFEAFAEVAGCGKGSHKHSSVFDCLVAADTVALQNASGIVSTTRGTFGSFAWLPVIDGDFIKMRPSLQLLLGKVSGKRLMVGNNANEGVPLTDPTIDTRAQYDNFISKTFPLFEDADIALLNAIYQVDEAQPGNNGVRFDTWGDMGPNALTQSSYATGIQQTVFNIAAETSFHCPGQWLAEAYSVKNRTAYKYLYSTAPSHHGADLAAYFSVRSRYPDIHFRSAFQKLWGNFIILDTPVTGYPPEPGPGNPPTRWLPYTGPENTNHSPTTMMEMNTTGGEITTVTVTDDLSYFIRSGPDIRVTFRIVDSMTWEGGRGLRCGFWRAVSSKVPQ